MKAHLMYRDRDFNLAKTMPAQAETLTQDLELNTLFNAMASGDEFLFQVAKQALFLGLETNLEIIHYRQANLKDCLRNETIVRSLYDLTIEAIESQRKGWFHTIGNYPRGILYGAVELLELLMKSLRKLRLFVDEHAKQFDSQGFVSFFALVKAELGDEYLVQVDDRLKTLKFRNGVLLSAELGQGNAGVNPMLRKSNQKEPNWLRRLIMAKPAGYTFRLPERDEAGARALSDLQDRGLNSVANVAAQSADHLLRFFAMLRAELAFYIGCLNLYQKLVQRRAGICFPLPAPVGERKHSCVGLRDVSLVLTSKQGVVGNELNGEGKNLVIITGANRGGKSTFLRAIGLAQLMMQCGMFVGADSFSANLCRGLFTHYKREEDATMKSGKFDEELARMSEIVDALERGSLVLFNESFAATNEREGSEIARQIVRALADAGVKMFFVTHQYAFAHRAYVEGVEGVLFLRAERDVGGHRSLKLRPGEPLPTSFGVDLYQEIFEGADKNSGLAAEPG
jgi:exonuclease VII small subunit